MSEYWSLLVTVRYPRMDNELVQFAAKVENELSELSDDELKAELARRWFCKPVIIHEVKEIGNIIELREGKK